MMENAADRVIVLDVVGLQRRHISSGLASAVADLVEADAHLRPPFPAVTLPAQTTLATGQAPAAHGDIANGEYDRERDAVAFWERERGDRSRLWERAGEAGLTTGALFFQHLVGTTADVAVTPSPIEDEDDNLIEMDCWTNPDDLYDHLRESLGHFPLHNYWGPGANEASSRWILDAAAESVRRHDPDLLWTYVPHLDYDAQRAGPESADLEQAVETVDGLVEGFLEELRGDDRWAETAVLVCSEYGFHTVDTPVLPNRALREAGLLAVRDDGAGGEEVDLAGSSAFAMVDHQVAHVYADDPAAAREAVAGLEGVDAVLGPEGKAERGVDHPNAGDLVLVADRDAWFQYYWWRDPDRAPRYAREMDIHAKPGYDPCELFPGEAGPVSTDPTKVSGSHGRVDEEAFAYLGLGGPAAPETALPDVVDARAVAPTVADLLGIPEVLEGSAERPSLFADDR